MCFGIDAFLINDIIQSVKGDFRTVDIRYTSKGGSNAELQVLKRFRGGVQFKFMTVNGLLDLIARDLPVLV